MGLLYRAMPDPFVILLILSSLHKLLQLQVSEDVEKPQHTPKPWLPGWGVQLLPPVWFLSLGQRDHTGSNISAIFFPVFPRWGKENATLSSHKKRSELFIFGMVNIYNHFLEESVFITARLI